MKFRIMLAACAATISACATEAPEPVEPPPPPMLTDAQFDALFNAAWNANPKPGSEVAFGELIARTDISEAQRAKAYYGRGAIRGIWVRDWPMAYPQCSVMDYREMERLAPDHRLHANMVEDRKYQFSRFQYFPNAPAACKDAAEAYRNELAGF